MPGQQLLGRVLPPLTSASEPRPLLVAHRGGAALAKENTLAAFERAAELGVPWIETDIRVTRDGVAVLHHDPTLHGDDVPIAARDAADLPAEVPTLRAYLERFGDTFEHDLELKTARGFAPTVALVRELGLEKRVMLTSFDHLALRASIARDGDLPHGALISSRPASVEALAATLPGLRWLAPHWERLDRELVDQAHALGLRVATWTVPTARAAEVSALGVDALIVDDPRPLLSAK